MRREEPIEDDTKTADDWSSPDPHTETHVLLRQTLAQASPACRRLIRAHYLEGKTLKETAEALDAPAERAYPLDDLLGLSLLVQGIACNWTGEFLRGGRDLRRAYGAFARGSVSERRLASVELVEAQRRAFLDRAEEALHLADRARGTFRALGLEDEAARAAGAHALALSYLGRDEEALAEFRGALPALAEAGRWSAYVSMLNGVSRFVRERDAVDDEILDSLEHVLSGESPDVDLLALLRSRAEEQLGERLRQAV